MAQIYLYKNQDFTGDKYTLTAGSGGAINFPYGGGPQEITEGDKTYQYIDGVFEARITGAAPKIDASSYPDSLYGQAVSIFKSNGAINSIYFFGHKINSNETIGADRLYCMTVTYNGVEFFAFGNLNGNVMRVAGAVSVDALEDTKQLKPETDDGDEYGDKSTGSTDAWGQGVAGTGDRNFDGVDSIDDLISDRAGIEGILNYASGGYHIYLINNGAYQKLSAYLWNQNGTLWKKLATIQANPAVGIVACHRLPSNLSLTTGATVTSILLAGLTCDLNGSTAYTLADQITGIMQSTITKFESVTLSLPGLIDALDYADTHVTVHLPYCGDCQIDASYCIGGLGDDGIVRSGTIKVLYRCDITNGNCVASVICTDRNGNAHVPAIMTGNCAYSVPFAGHNNGLDQAFGALLGVGTSIVATAASGGVAAPALVGSTMAAAQSMILPKQSTIANPITGSTAILQDGIITVTVDYPLVSNPENYNITAGRPSDTGGKVSDYDGYTVAKSIFVDGISRATDAQKAEIERLFKGGVYL